VGEIVVDVFAGEGEREPDWLGAHVHGPLAQPWPRGASPIVVPDDAPSRAFAKIEEALLWSGAPVRRGDLAIEIGSAPGGASLALLRRGVDVVGVDPGEMDARVLAFGDRPRFSHLRAPIGALGRSDLPKDADWILIDVNLAPPVALRYLERVVGPRRRRLLGVVATLKLGDAAMAARATELAARVGAMGFERAEATQLPSNRSEICVVALSARACRRAPEALRRARPSPSSS
jgi:23S rRNA (cytidine2498-2'-O)-methyltransferase